MGDDISESCPVMDFGVTGVESPDPATKELPYEPFLHDPCLSSEPQVCFPLLVQQLLIACLEFHSLMVCVILNLLSGGLMFSCLSGHLVLQLLAAESVTEGFTYSTAWF